MESLDNCVTIQDECMSRKQNEIINSHLVFVEKMFCKDGFLQFGKKILNQFNGKLDLKRSVINKRKEKSRLSLVLQYYWFISRLEDSISKKDVFSLFNKMYSSSSGWNMKPQRKIIRFTLRKCRQKWNFI